MIKEALQEINERKKYINSHRTTSEIELMMHGNIPITSNTMKKFEVDKEVFHLTDLLGAINLKKIQGQFKMIAGFSKGSDSIAPGGGKLTDGNVLTKLKGKASFISPHDLGTYLDRNGDRWIPWDQAVQSDFLWDNFTKKITTKIKKKFGLEDSDSIEYYTKILTLSKKESNLFVKWYFEESKKLLTKTFIKKFLIELNRESLMWQPSDETLLHSFSILDVKVVTDDQPSAVGETETLMLESELAEASIEVSGRLTRKQVSKLKIK